MIQRNDIKQQGTRCHKFTCIWSVCVRVCCCVCSCCCCCCGAVASSAAPSLLRLISAWLRDSSYNCPQPASATRPAHGDFRRSVWYWNQQQTRKIILYYYNIEPSMKSLSVRNEYLSWSVRILLNITCYGGRRNECNPSIILLQPNL